MRNNKLVHRLLALPIAVMMLSSCTLLDQLGFDTYDYMGETVISTHHGDSEIAESILPLLDILITDNIHLPEFDNMRSAVSRYRDAVLRYMLETEYAKYSGNTTLVEKAAAAYPELQITQIIPADDFEATVYEYFGGDVKIGHKSGDMFTYLKKVEGYTCNIIPKDSDIFTEILSVDETAKTYRVHFRCTMDEQSMEYKVLIIKRDDATLYFKRLEFVK